MSEFKCQICGGDNIANKKGCSHYRPRQVQGVFLIKEKDQIKPQLTRVDVWSSWNNVEWWEK